VPGDKGRRGIVGPGPGRRAYSPSPEAAAVPQARRRTSSVLDQNADDNCDEQAHEDSDA
jgi:hypothetical protein